MFKSPMKGTTAVSSATMLVARLRNQLNLRLVDIQLLVSGYINESHYNYSTKLEICNFDSNFAYDSTYVAVVNVINSSFVNLQNPALGAQYSLST